MLLSDGFGKRESQVARIRVRNVSESNKNTTPDGFARTKGTQCTSQAVTLNERPYASGGIAIIASISTSFTTDWHTISFCCSCVAEERRKNQLKGEAIPFCPLSANALNEGKIKAAPRIETNSRII